MTTLAPWSGARRRRSYQDTGEQKHKGRTTGVPGGEAR